MILIKKRQKMGIANRRFILTLLISLILALAACGAEEAAEAPIVEEEPVVEAPLVQEEVPVAGQEAQVEQFPIRVSELIADDVMTVAQEDLGKIAGVIAGLHNNLDYVLISPEGLIDFGNENFLIPLSALSPAAEEDAFFVDQAINASVLQTAPRFSGDWMVIDDPAWDDSFFNYWQGLGIVTTQPNGIESPIGGPMFIRAGELIGDDVMNVAMVDLGKIEEVIVTNDPRRADYVLVSPQAGLFNIGEGEQFVVPLNRLQASAEEDAFFLAVEEAAFPSAPRFRREAPPNLADPAWEEPLIIFWAAQPVAGLQLTPTPLPPTPIPPTPVPATPVPMATPTPAPPPTVAPRAGAPARPAYFPPPCRYPCRPNYNAFYPRGRCLPPFGQPVGRWAYGPGQRQAPPHSGWR